MPPLHRRLRAYVASPGGVRMPYGIWAVHPGGASPVFAMRQYYRLYCVNQDGRIVGVEETHCDTDDDAEAHAGSRLAGLSKCDGIEIWNLDRFVSWVSRPGALPAGT